eukprot:COSAG06_NODE_66627_length_254_cov_0.503226_1_plen_45_part_10
MRIVNHTAVTDISTTAYTLSLHAAISIVLSSCSPFRFRAWSDTAA